MARATGLEPAASGVTGRKFDNQIRSVGYFSIAGRSHYRAKVSGRVHAHQYASCTAREWSSYAVLFAGSAHAAEDQFNV